MKTFDQLVDFIVEYYKDGVYSVNETNKYLTALDKYYFDNEEAGLVEIRCHYKPSKIKCIVVKEGNND